MEILVLAAIIGLIPAAIAKNKGRSFFGWWVYGTLLFIIALPHSMLIQKDIVKVEEQQLKEGMKKCLYCAEMIKEEAVVCRFCGREIKTEGVITEDMIKALKAEELVKDNLLEEVLKKLKNEVGGDFVTFAKTSDIEWLCVCGALNKSQNCSSCKRSKGFVLENYTKDKFDI